MAHRTLVSNACNITVSRPVLTEWTIAENAKVDLGTAHRFRDGVVDRRESVSRMDLADALKALETIVPIRTGEAFVANAHNILDPVSIEFQRG